MKKFSMTYIAMHDSNGKPMHKSRITIKDYVPALNNPLAYLVYLWRVRSDALALNVVANGKVPFHFYISRAKHYGYLYIDAPRSFNEYLSFYRKFFQKILGT